MRRHELGGLLSALLVGLALGAVSVRWSGWFSSDSWANGTSNLLGLIAAPAMILGVGIAAWDRWHCRCAVPRCLRRGAHEVAGTTRRVCGRHHDRASHRLCRKLHHRPGRLGWGDRPD